MQLEIQDLLISLIPSISALLACIISVITFFTKMKNLKKIFEDKTDMKAFRQDLKQVKIVLESMKEELDKSNKEIEYWKNMAINRTTSYNSVKDKGVSNKENESVKDNKKI